MSWFEILLCDYQPEPFVVEADSFIDAMDKTMLWAIKSYPGMFVKTENNFRLVANRYPLISKIGEWH